MGFLQSTQNEKLWSYARYEYDALRERIRITEFGTYDNKTFSIDLLLLFRRVIIYLFFANLLLDVCPIVDVLVPERQS